MKLASVNAIENCLSHHMKVDVEAESLGLSFTLWKNDGLIVVDELHNEESIKFFHSFEGGSENEPDLEKFLNGWVETINAEDCIIDIL